MTKLVAGLPWLFLLLLGLLCFFAMPWSYAYPAATVLGAGSLALVIGLVLAHGLSRLPWRAPSRPWVWFWGLLALGLLLRLAYLLAVPPQQLSDSLDLTTLARNLLEGRGYRQPRGEHELLAFRPPGYPLALAATMGLVGDRWWTPALLNMFCYGLASAMLFDLGRRLQGLLPGLFAVAALAVWPSGVMISGRALTEWLSLTLLLMTFWCLVRGRGETRWRWWLLAGVSLGLGALVRPPVLLLPGLLILLALLEPGQRRQRLQFALLTTLVAAACVLPWTWRNYQVLNAFVPISTNGGDNFYRANNGIASGGFEPYGEKSFEHLLPDEVAWNKATMAAGTQWVRENPLRFARLAVRKLALLVGEDGEGAVLSLKRVYRETGPKLKFAIAISSVWWLAVWACVVLALYRRRQRLWANPALAALLWLTAFLPLIHAVFESQPRYHMPMVGLLLLLAGLIAAPAEEARQ
jgi:4-amino-4-deoxy-L-arabinose transferase-like glycosyltransferase